MKNYGIEKKKDIDDDEPKEVCKCNFCHSSIKSGDMYAEITEGEDKDKNACELCFPFVGASGIHKVAK